MVPKTLVPTVCLVLICLAGVAVGKDQGENALVLAKRKAITWFLSERLPDWGWGGMPTAYALIAMEVTKMGDHLHRELTAKQMEIDLILQLWRHHETPALTSAQIAMYALALTSSCQDPRQFHGIDLIGSLLHHSEPDSDSEFAICSLAMCSAGSHVRKRHLRRLLNIANTKHTVDSLSGVVIALKCIVRDHRNRNLQHYLKKPILSLARSQQPDGSFGNEYSTSLAIQALYDESVSWNKTAALKWLHRHQSSDGSFIDVPTTANVIIALSNKGIGSIKDIDCEKSEMDESEPGASIIPHVVSETKAKPEMNLKINKTKSYNEMNKTSINSKGGSEVDVHNEDATVTYTLWVGSNVTENRTITMDVAHNSTFYNVMQLASERDPEYMFAATEWPNGHYVHTLAGFKEQPMSYHYWLLYRLPNLPDPNNPPGNQFVAPTGVDDLIVKDGEHYLFWYKKL